MTVYVDDMQADYRRMKMCHMVADTDEELLQLGAKEITQREVAMLIRGKREALKVAKKIIEIT